MNEIMGLDVVNVHQQNYKNVAFLESRKKDIIKHMHDI